MEDELKGQVARNVRVFQEPLSRLLRKCTMGEVMGMHPLTQKQRLTRVWEYADRVQAAIGKNCACTKNQCSHCCKQAVTIHHEEAKRISQSLGIQAHGVSPYTDPQQMQDSILRQRDEYLGKACPFLQAGKCRVYAVRPLSCRLHFNASDDPSLCDTIARPGGEVPCVDLGAVYQLAAEALMDTNWADIREFFPKGAGE